MITKFAAYMKDVEIGCYVAIVRDFTELILQADTLVELQIRLKEVLELCLEK